MAAKEIGPRDFAFALPDIVRMLWRIVRDPDVSLVVRASLLGVAAYLATPVDLVPDWIPVLGQMDDLIVVTLGVRTLLRNVPEPILQSHWSGERRILEAILGRPLRNAPAGGV